MSGPSNDTFKPAHLGSAIIYKYFLVGPETMYAEVGQFHLGQEHMEIAEYWVIISTSIVSDEDFKYTLNMLMFVIHIFIHLLHFHPLILTRFLLPLRELSNAYLLPECLVSQMIIQLSSNINRNIVT